MGEVFKATDTTLQRPVAIKMLPAVFADDRDRVARLEREAKLLAALNHPNIAAIHGLEEFSDATAADNGSADFARRVPSRRRPPLRHDLSVNGNRDTWTLNLDRLALSRLTDGPTEDVLPVWAPDGQRVYFSSNRTGNFDIYSQAADGASGARVEYAGPGTQILTSFVPDGSGLLVYENYADTNLLRLAQPDRIEPLLANPEFDQRIPVVSPDGRWIAYESDESGTQFEVYLRPYPNVNGRREKISLDGGRFPVWGPRDSHELYYQAADGAMMAVVVTTEPDLELGRPTKLFDWAPPPASRSGTPYDVSPLDGRFLMIKALGARNDETTYVSVILNSLP